MMAYRKRSLDLPVPNDFKQSRSSTANELPPIRNLTDISYGQRNLPHAIPSLRHFHTSNNVSTIRHTMGHTPAAASNVPRNNSISVPPPIQVPTSSSALQQQHPPPPLSSSSSSSYQLGQSNQSVGGDAIKIARNWSRDETLSLVRAIGRNYETLKRCKTNQERSNVWHQIHKEHSHQFPGRSKKASQDRWGKVLSDYKDVIVHNKEKGAARWTFDFFTEVGNIVGSDCNHKNPSSSSSPPSQPPPDSSQGNEDLHAYSLRHGPISAPAHMAQHRMSEPNLGLSLSYRQQHQQQQHQRSSLMEVEESSDQYNTRRISYPQTLIAQQQQQSHQNPEQTCRYVLDLLQTQMKRIDSEQQSLLQLRESTQDTIAKVEKILGQYSAHK